MANKIQFEYNRKSKKELKAFVKPYPKNIIESFISFASNNSLLLDNKKIINELTQLAKDHEKLYYE